MSQIGPSKWTRAERLLRMVLVNRGARFRAHVGWGPGLRWKADFLLLDLGVLVDVHGHFWHSPRSPMKNMSRFWRVKIRENRARDRRKVAYARENGLAYVVLDERDVVGPGRIPPTLLAWALGLPPR